MKFQDGQRVEFYRHGRVRIGYVTGHYLFYGATRYYVRSNGLTYSVLETDLVDAA